MEIAGYTLAPYVSGFPFLFVGADADILYFPILIEHIGHGQPTAARGRAIGIRIEPTLLDTGDIGVGEHAGTGGFFPGFRIVQELPPQTALRLQGQQELNPG